MKDQKVTGKKEKLKKQEEKKNKSKNGQWPLWAFVTCCCFVGSVDLHTSLLYRLFSIENTCDLPIFF